jgi:hypothetical protein
VSAPPDESNTNIYATQLIASLTQFGPGNGITPQRAEELKKSFKQLAAQGAAAVPAIREYLARFQDIDFDSVGAGKLVGYPSLRLGLMDVLGQIGGSEATDLLLQTLQKTGDPQEIAMLAKNLDKQLAPDQVRSAAVTAASEVLAQTLSGKWDGRNVSSLFEVLQKYGDENVVGLLEQSATKWNYYATLALAGLPDGTGVPALIRLAQDPALRSSGNGDIALRPLAQAALQYPAARDALVDQARLNQIPDNAWATVASSLAGHYIQYGNQIFGSTVPMIQWSDDQIRSRLALIDSVLAVTSNPAGRQALLNAQATISTIAEQRK